jgi:ribonucleotide monophosphatase NagD (HAD superfamily)
MYLACSLIRHRFCLHRHRLCVQVLPGGGTMVNMIEFNTGRAPEVVVGKPNPLMLTVLTKAAHLDPARRYQGSFVLFSVVAVAVAVVIGAVVAVCPLVLPLVLPLLPPCLTQLVQREPVGE